jgi:voltage-gated potassium channel
MSSPFWAAEHWCQDESGKVRHSFEAVALLCALLMLPAVLIQDSGLHSPWGVVADVLNAVVWLAFTVELALTLHHARDRRAAIRSHWADALVVVVLFPPWALLFAALGPGWLRAWRLARLWVIAARVFRAEGLLMRRRNLPYIGALTLLLVTVTGIAVTTVGYGDTFPTSAVGRVVASVLMVVGIGFLSLATASIAGHFVNQDAEDKHREATDKQKEILAELRRVHERLDRIEARN